MEGAGVYFKASLCGKIYKHLSFLVEEDIRPRDDFKEAEWFLTCLLYTSYSQDHDRRKPYSLRIQ